MWQYAKAVKDLTALQRLSAAVSGFEFLAFREAVFFLRRGRFLGGRSSDAFASFALAPLEDPGPTPKKAPGNESALAFFEAGRELGVYPL